MMAVFENLRKESMGQNHKDVFTGKMRLEQNHVGVWIYFEMGIREQLYEQCFFWECS